MQNTDTIEILFWHYLAAYKWLWNNGFCVIICTEICAQIYKQVKSRFDLLCALSNSTKIVALLSEVAKIYLFRYWDSALHLKVYEASIRDFHWNQSDNDKSVRSFRYKAIKCHSSCREVCTYLALPCLQNKCTEKSQELFTAEAEPNKVIYSSTAPQTL